MTEGASTAKELLSAIQRHCLECSGGSRKEVDRCKVSCCALWKYRNHRAMGIVKPEKALAGQMTIEMYISDKLYKTRRA